MLEAIAVLLVCQLMGELIVIGLGLPLPGPVIGMAILFFGLVFYGKVPEALGSMTKGLLDQLSLLFVPAGVGVMTHLTLLGEEWLPITASLVISTLVTLGLTGIMMQKLVVKADQTNSGVDHER
ncbi:MAG: CidA/LrgA family protein [Gammaproteobacteria bacterium]|nr:CidA/LrgA family protein [Gammaproteobacteria bacterium]